MKPLHYPSIILVMAVSATLLGLTLFLHLWKGVPFYKLFGDPNSVSRAPFYTGFLSQIGIFFWSASTTVCIVSRMFLPQHEDYRHFRCFLFSSAFFSLCLGLDDTFLIHEKIFPRFGVPQKIVLGCYAGFALLYVLWFHSQILKTEYGLLGISCFFFGVSLVIDVWLSSVHYKSLIEDAPKLIGTISWLAYFFRVAKYVANINNAQHISSHES